MRAVRTPKTGPLISGAKNDAANSATMTTGQGGRNGSTHIGTRKARIAIPASRSGATFRTTTIAARLPTSAPAPSAA